MSFLDTIFGGGKKKDPMGEAMPYLDQIPGVGHDYYDPYINQGRESSNLLHETYQGLINDPTALINQIMGTYKTSEGYNFAKDNLMKELSGTAAAGGIAGTPIDQKNQLTGIQGLLSQDMQQYLANILGTYNTGLQGEEGIANKGFGASGAMTDLLGNALNQKAGLAYQNANQYNQDQNNKFNNIMKLIGTGAGAAGGYLLSPPGTGLKGASMGANIGSKIFG